MFKLYCAAQYKRHPHKMVMYKDGTVGKQVRYQDICSQEIVVNIAYNNFPPFFELVNNSMVEYKPRRFGSENSMVPYDYEILSKFFQHKNIIPNWINCNGSFGVYNKTSEKWTGAIGKVFTYLLLTTNNLKYLLD